MQEFINGKLLIDGKLIQKDFLLKDKHIFFDYEKTDNPRDIKGMVVSPSFIDLHVHTRVPGYEHKEDLEHIVEACKAGGFKTIVAMSNINPLPTNFETLDHIQKMLSNDEVEIIQTGRVTKTDGKVADIKEMSKLTNIFTDDGHPINIEGTLKDSFELVKENNGLILLHEEGDHFDGHAYASEFTKANNIKSFSSEYEWKSVERDIAINKSIGARMHIQHISTKETIELVKRAKEDMPITSEVTPHHLCFSSEDIKGSTNFKMNPPLNSKKDMDTLRKAFLDGDIEIIATDHAPHALSEKDKKWEEAANGIIGLETAFAAVNTIFPKNLERVLEGLSVAPGKLIGRDVSIKTGKDLSLVLIDPNIEWTFTEKDIYSKSKNSPWIGRKLVGKVKEIIC